MSEDEVNERFNEVLEDAYLADVEAEEAAIDAMREEMTDHLKAGLIPVHVVNINNVECIAIPVDIMHSIVTAVKDYCEFGAEVNAQLEIGNAGIIIDSFLTDFQIKALVTKCAFITLAYINHQEEQE